MKFNKDQKIQILLAELSERYSASHIMRKRSMQFTLWISGMALGLAWIVLNQTLALSQKWSLTALVGVSFLGTLYFLYALRCGFTNNRKATINTESALGMYKKGVFLSKESLLPKEYSKIKRNWSNHFITIIVWIIFMGGTLLTLIWFSPTEKRHFNNANLTKSKTIIRNMKINNIGEIYHD